MKTSDRAYLQLAYEAAAKSPDPSNQNGAVLVAANTGQRCIDYNRFPTDFPFDPTHLSDRDKKIRYIEHAERTVIYQAASLGVMTHGATLYCPWFACMECA